MRKEAQAIKSIRQACGISQAQLAATLGYKTAQFISNSERDLCGLPLEAIWKISEAYGRRYGKILANAKIEDARREILKHLH